jgi:hypothetical protein
MPAGTRISISQARAGVASYRVVKCARGLVACPARSADFASTIAFEKSGYNSAVSIGSKKAACVLSLLPVRQEHEA